MVDYFYENIMNIIYKIFDFVFNRFGIYLYREYFEILHKNYNIVWRLEKFGLNLFISYKFNGK